MSTSAEGTILDGFTVDDSWVGPLKTGSLLTVGPLRMRIELSDMAKDDPLPNGRMPGKRALEQEPEESGAWKLKVYRKNGNEKELALQRQQDYKDRAQERRKRCGEEAGSGNAAIDHLIDKYNAIKAAEEASLAAEEERVEMPTQEAQREANMSTDGSFVGFGMGAERAGIGFQSESTSAELIPNVLDPKNLSQAESSRMKTQMRFKQASKR
jgi:hypothetical protein